MDFKQKPLSIFQLIIGALKTANQAFGSVLALCVYVGCLLLLLAAVVFGIFYIFHVPPAIWIPFYWFASLLSVAIGLTVFLAIIQLLAGILEKTGVGVVDSFSSSFVPALYCFVSSLILFVPIALTALTHSKILVAIVTVAIYFLSLFTPQVIVLRGEGPVSALVYSFELVRSRYFKVLGSLLSLFVLGILLVLAVGCAIKVFLPSFTNPQNFLMTFMLTNPSNPKALFSFLTNSMHIALPILVCCFIVFTFLHMYAFLTVQALLTLLFLNLDYCHQGVAELEDLQATTKTISPTTQVPDIQIKQASVKTQAGEYTEPHLDQVYTAEEHLAKAVNQEEDRMPTLFFDETMTRQLADTERRILEQQANANKPKPQEDDRPIKMSDDTI